MSGLAVRQCQRGHTLLELLVWMGLVSVGLSSAVSLYGAERVTSRKQTEVFRVSAASSAILFELSRDLRRAERVVPRQEGPGALIFLADGSVVGWFSRPGREREIHRKVMGPDGIWGQTRVVGRGVSQLEIVTDGDLFVARIGEGNRQRSVTVWRRHHAN